MACWRAWPVFTAVRGGLNICVEGRRQTPVFMERVFQHATYQIEQSCDQLTGASIPCPWMGQKCHQDNGRKVNCDLVSHSTVRF